MEDSRVASEFIKDMKTITVDDVYRFVGKWVIWGAIARTAVRLVSK